MRFGQLIDVWLSKLGLTALANPFLYLGVWQHQPNQSHVNKTPSPRHRCYSEIGVCCPHLHPLPWDICHKPSSEVPPLQTLWSQTFSVHSVSSFFQNSVHSQVSCWSATHWIQASVQYLWSEVIHKWEVEDSHENSYKRKALPVHVLFCKLPPTLCASGSRVHTHQKIEPQMWPLWSFFPDQESPHRPP